MPSSDSETQRGIRNSEADTMEDLTVERKNRSKQQRCLKTQRKHWYLNQYELLCESHEVTGSKEWNTTRMEKVLKRGAHVQYKPPWPQPNENGNQVSPGMGSMEWERTRTPLTTNTETDYQSEGGCKTQVPVQREERMRRSHRIDVTPVRWRSLLTSSGADKVTVGELRLRGRRIWGSIRWLLLFVADPDAPSSASYVGGKHRLASCEALPARVTGGWTQQHSQRWWEVWPV